MARATSIFYTAKSVRRQPTFSPLDKSRRAFLGAFLTLVVLTSTCAVFYIGTHIQAVNLGYKIGLELQRKEHLIEENKRLDLEIARLNSPTRIEEEAKVAFGLVLPKTQQVYYLSRWNEELDVHLATTLVTEKVIAVKDPVKIPAVAPVKTIAKAPEKIKAEKPKVKTTATCHSTTCHSEDPKGPKNLIPPKAVADPSLALRMTQSVPKKAAPALAQSTKTSTLQPAKVAATNPIALKKPEAPKSDLSAKPAVASTAKPSTPKALAQNTSAPASVKTLKTPAAVPSTAKSEAIKPAKAPAAKPSAETKLPKKEGVMVARIVEKAPAVEKSAKPKAGPALAYQPKDKVPAVMLDPMP